MDGDGRIARIMMIAELVKSGDERIIIPTVFRGNYLSALKALSLNGLVRTLDFAQKWAAAIQWADLEGTRRELDGCNAFMDPKEADDRGIRLHLPNGLP